MFENVINFFKGLGKNKNDNKSKDAAKERLHLVLMQDRANISADFLALMKQEIIEVIKKYIDVDENSIDVRLTNKSNEDGTTGAPVLYANIPIVSVKEEAKEEARKIQKGNTKQEDNKEVKKENDKTEKESVKEKEDNKDKKIEEEKEETKEEKKAQEVIEKAEEIVEEIKEEDKEDNKEESKEETEENVNS